MPGMLGSGTAALGGAVHNLMKGRSSYNAAIRAARGSMPVGMRGSLADTAYKMNLKSGKKVIGGAVGVGLMGRANQQRPVGGYNPRRPIMPVPQNGRAM